VEQENERRREIGQRDQPGLGGLVGSTRHDEPDIDEDPEADDNPVERDLMFAVRAILQPKPPALE
jgi:hypothetical protein